MNPILRVEGVSLNYGGVAALREVTFAMAEGELAGLIGPNGAGKTTLFNAVSGFVAPTLGHIFFAGENITGKKPHVLARRGLVRSFQGARIFPRLTVRESLRVALHLPEGRRAGRQSPLLADPMAELDLERYADEPAGTIPSGKMRELGIAMAVSTGARLLLLDEPAAGLSAAEASNLQRVVKKVHAAGAGVLVIEHNLQFLMGLVPRVLVLDAGGLIADGAPQAITREPSVVEAYLGSSAHA